jgi:hypothetical protein
MATAVEWAERVNTWRASGKTARRFCEESGYSTKSLLAWSSRLGRKADKKGNAVSEVRLARVVREPVRVNEPLVVQVGGARIEIRAGVDRAALAALLNALLSVRTEGAAP